MTRLQRRRASAARRALTEMCRAITKLGAARSGCYEAGLGALADTMKAMAAELSGSARRLAVAVEHLDRGDPPEVATAAMLAEWGEAAWRPFPAAAVVYRGPRGAR